MFSGTFLWEVWRMHNLQCEWVLDYKFLRTCRFQLRGKKGCVHFFILGYIIMLDSMSLSYKSGFKNKKKHQTNSVFDKTVNTENYEVNEDALVLTSGEWDYAMYFPLYLLNIVNTGILIFCCYSHKQLYLF